MNMYNNFPFKHYIFVPNTFNFKSGKYDIKICHYVSVWVVVWGLTLYLSICKIFPEKKTYHPTVRSFSKPFSAHESHVTHAESGQVWDIHEAIDLNIFFSVQEVMKNGKPVYYVIGTIVLTGSWQIAWKKNLYEWSQGICGRFLAGTKHVGEKLRLFLLSIW